jgi:hypothetical protein
MDNCSAHTSPAVIQLPSQHRLEAITLPPHTSGVFQMLDLVFFGGFKRVKKHLAKDPSRRVTEDQAVRMFKACKSAGTTSTVRTLVLHPEFIYVRGADGGYTLALNEAKVRGATEFREVSDMVHAVEKLNGRRGPGGVS